MKLYSILFESVGESDILNLIRKIINSRTKTGDELKQIILFRKKYKNHDVPITELLNRLVKEIYKQNKDQFDRMFKDVDKIKYLDGGSIGVAFDLGDKILKIEQESKAYYSAGERAEKAATALYPEPRTKSVKQLSSPAPISKKTVNLKEISSPSRRRSEVGDDLGLLEENVDRNIGKYVPMIYDKGVITYTDEGTEIKLNWILMEKFEPLHGIERVDMDELLYSITDKFVITVTKNVNLEQIKDISTYQNKEREIHSRLESELRLKDGWFADLVQGMWELKQKGIVDFHAGNIGIRRTGGEGSLVFFD